MDNQEKSAFGVKNGENKLLHNFTIPKIKRVAEKGCFVHCMPSQREFRDIQCILDKEKLNMDCELKSSWSFFQMQLVMNSDLECNFSEKRTEMKVQGRHGRELEEKFCFLVVPNQVAIDISKNGLNTGNMITKVLGKPEMGVYLFRHIDVALNFAHRRNMDSVVVVLFKVLCGKVKTINTSSAIKTTLDPTPNFDSHVSKKPPSWNEPFDDQVTSSLIYLYEYDSNLKPVKTPRHILPTASVRATFIVQKSVSTSGPVRPPKSVTSGNGTFASCTVAQRIGKGKDATIIFKSVHSALPKPSRKEDSQNSVSEKEAQALPFTALDHHSHMLSASTIFHDPVLLSDTKPSNKFELQNLMASCMVMTSKSMKDPRLLKRNELEALVPTDQCLLSHQKPNSLCGNQVPSNEAEDPNKNMFFSCENTIKNSSHFLSFEEKRFFERDIPKEEIIKKLNNYSSFLSLNKNEREAKIQSLAELSANRKVGFSRKLCTYGKYANQLEISKETQQSKMTLALESSPSTNLGLSVCMLGCATTGNDNCNFQDKNKVFLSWSDRPGENSQCMPQITSRESKAPARTNNDFIENYSEEPTCPKSHVMHKSTIGTIKANVLQNGKSSLNHGNCKREPLRIGKNMIQKVGEYPIRREVHNDVKSQRTILKVDVDVSTEINAANSDLNPSRMTDPPLSHQDKNKVFLSWSDRPGENSQCMPQITSQESKAPARTNDFIENYSEEPTCPKSHVMHKSTIGTIKANVLQNGKSSLNHGNCKREPLRIGKNMIQKVGEYPIRREVHNNVKSQRTILKVDVDVSAEINAANSDLNPSRMTDPPLSHQKMNLQKAEENCILKKILENKIQKLKVKREFKKAHTISNKQIAVSKPKGLKSKMKMHNENLILRSFYNVDKGASIKEIHNTDHSNSPVVSPPLEISMCNTYSDATETSHFEKISGEKLVAAKNMGVHDNIIVDQSRYVIELENRIDWKGIFGMEMEEANALMADSHSSSLRRERDPSGMRIFPDMEITVVNNYALTYGSANNLNGEMHPSVGVKDDVDELFESLKMFSPSCQRTEHGSEMQISVANLPDCKTLVEPLSSLQVAGMILSDNNVCMQNEITFDTNNDDKTLNHTIKKRQSKKRIPSVLIKRSAARINKFSQSEENIKVVLGMLSDEIPLCKNKRISKKLDRAILHLRKAHKRVQKSLQLVAKGRDRRNVPKTGSVKDNEKIQTSNVIKHLKRRIETTESKELQSKSQLMKPTSDSLMHVTSDLLQEKSSLTDRKCLTESTDVINGVSVQESQLTKIVDNSPQASHSSTFKSNSCSPDTSEGHHDVSSLEISNKENAAPVITPKTPSENKGGYVENSETVVKDSKLHDASFKRPSVCLKRVFSQVRKHSFHTKTLPKCSKKVSLLSSERSQIKAKRMTERVFVTKKNATTPNLVLKLSNILQKASRTHSLKALQDCQIFCKKMLPVFINAFEKKQQCILKDVIMDRRLFLEQNLKTRFQCSLKPQALEAFLELQVMMETDQYIENKIHYIEGKPTFRSFLWYDRSLYTELLTGESGFQQQSHIYAVFQKKLEHDALATLESHYARISEFLQTLNNQNSSHYVYLKYKRELKECEDILKNSCDHSAFSLSVPLTCGVHLGDTIDDLTSLQKSTFEIISAFVKPPKCDSGKREHALCLLEIISAKIHFIKTTMTVSMQVSLFGFEHLLFDAAKMMFYWKRRKYDAQNTIPFTKAFMVQTNRFALSNLYEVYCFTADKMKHIEKQSDIWKGNIMFDVNPAHNVFLVGKIIDQARCAKPKMLKQMILDCKQQLQDQIKCFQILQECNVHQVLIRENNVLEISKRPDCLPTLLKSEAVEAFIELVMMYETLHFLDCIIASQRSQETTRGLLWYDSSLLSDLLHNQERLVSFLQGDSMLDGINLIDSTISEIKSELEVISDCTNSINYSYAFQIMTRELSELSELKDFVLKSKPSLGTYLHFTPYVASLHYGSTAAELDHNYNQLSGFLAILMSSPKKDLGKMAHTVKIMKTIELTKAFVLNSNKSAFDLITCHILQNRVKHDQVIPNERPKESRSKMLNDDQLSRKRLCSQTSGESVTFLKPKKQKIIKSYENKRKENRMKSNLSAEKPVGMSGTELHCKEPSSVKTSVKDPPHKDDKALLFSRQKDQKREYIKEMVAAAGIHKRSEKESQPNSTVQQCPDKRNKSASPLANSSPEAAISTDMYYKDQAPIESACIDSLCAESLPSTEPDKDKYSMTQETPHSSRYNNVNECSRDTTASEELKTLEDITEVQETNQDTNPTEVALLQRQPTNGNNQPIPPMSNRIAQYPGSVNPFNHPLYLWHQNGCNTNVMSQGYQGAFCNIQQPNPYNHSSAVPSVQNAYAEIHPYGNITSQFQAQMYQNTGPFGAVVPYNYNNHSSELNNVPSSYFYSSSSNLGWPWNSWQ